MYSYSGQFGKLVWIAVRDREPVLAITVWYLNLYSCQGLQYFNLFSCIFMLLHMYTTLPVLMHIHAAVHVQYLTCSHAYSCCCTCTIHYLFSCIFMLLYMYNTLPVLMHTCSHAVVHALYMCYLIFFVQEVRPLVDINVKFIHFKTCIVSKEFSVGRF